MNQYLSLKKYTTAGSGDKYQLCADANLILAQAEGDCAENR